VNILDLSGSTRALVAAAIALVPAIVAYVRGRQVARFADDPALPERLFAGSRAASTSIVLTIAALIVLTGRAAIWAIPLAAIGYIAAGLPLRRLLYNETWTVAVYLSFVIRFFIAFWSFWALVGALPALAVWAGERAWVVALVMGAGLLLLAARQTEVIRWLIGARPIGDEAIRARFDRLVAAAGLPEPHFEFVDLKGGSMANAFALPSLGRGAVVFSGPLLQRLDADEIDAICAHELAHLEYYNPGRLRQRRLVSRSLVIGGALLGPVLQGLMPSFASLACVAWPAVVLTTLVILVHDRQKHETASDLRAVALTGNPEALVRALVKLHAIARVPRRWDADLERHLSHPSLKRRIQDIRAAAGTPPAALGAATLFESADGAIRVIFGDESLEWIEGTSASHRLRYDRLSELRIAATRTGETSLLTGDRTGHRWQMPLRAADVARLQAVLDIVDARVGATAPAMSFQPVLLKAATFAVCIISLNAGLFAVAMVLAMTLMRPEAPLVGAAGIAAIAGAALTWRDRASAYGFIPDEYKAIFAAVLLAGGALLVWLAYVRRREELSTRVWRLVGVVAAATVASWLLPIMGRGIDAVGLHQVAREWPATVVLPLALAGAMLWSSRKMVRLASAVAVVAGVAAAGVGSQAFLDRFGGDLFLLPAADLKVRTLDRPVKEFAVPFGLSELHLSPGGRSIAAVTWRRDNRTTIHIGRAGETLTPLDVQGVLFIDDDRALVWTVDGSRTDLREVLVAAPEAAGWHVEVTGLTTPAVSLDPKSKRWRLTSRAGVTVVEARDGVIGTEQINSHRWSVPGGRPSPFMPIALSGDRALVLEPRPDLASPIADPLGALVFVLASAPRWRSTIWALGPDEANDLGTSRLELECHPLPLADQGACQIFDASRTRFFAMDAGTRRITPVASLPGRFFVGKEPEGAWLTGWYQSSPAAVRISPADAVRVAGPDGARAHILAVSDRVAAGVWHQIPPTSAMRVEPIQQLTGTSVIRIFAID
jgi:Zn-dependent protease with chaperone function